MTEHLPVRVGDRTFEGVLFDWDGTAVPDRRSDATAMRARVHDLCAAGVHVFVVSGTHVGNVDGQLQARPSGPGQLHLCLNRGSEVFVVTPGGPSLVWRRTATATEERQLDEAATATVDVLRRRGLAAEIVSERLNRRKIDLIPEPAWGDPPKARIVDLLEAVTARLRGAGIDDLAEVVAIAVRASAGAGLVDARVTSDVKHVEIGLTDKSDAGRWAVAWLAERGVTGGLVLVAGDELGPLGGVPGSDSRLLEAGLERATVVSVGAEPGGCPAGVLHLPGGPERFLAVLDAQLERRRSRRVPSIDPDPSWVLPLPDDAARARASEALGTLANGWTGTRGSFEEDGPGTLPLFVVNGTYTGDEGSRLLPGPHWTQLEVARPPERGHRLLDLRTGVLLRRRDDGPGLRSLRFASAARPHALALRAEAATTCPMAPGAIATLVGGEAPAVDIDVPEPGQQAAMTCSPGGGGIAVATRDRSGTVGPVAVVERIAAWGGRPDGPPDRSELLAELERLDEVGFDGLLAEHRAAWAERWADAEVVIEGALQDQLAARFAVFHLLSAAPDAGEAAVGARGLTGAAYGGHVFWDADVFVLPALAALRPGAARAMLEYRIRRLPAARAAARAEGLTGARFPWESAAEGIDVTPRSVRGPRGERIVVRTGAHEVHIVADVAWAAWEYAQWSGDAAFLTGPGRDLVVEPARWWASRIRRDSHGRGHLLDVMGPDEYHEVVDDNAYTNVMARWNLRRAAELMAPEGAVEVSRWLDLAGSLVDGYDPERQLYEQFTGYWRLEPLLVADVAEPPVAADVLLGAERIAGSQIIKQADVLMLHHLVPEEVAPGSLAPNLAHYAPRTAHGSSLSPAIHAALLARAGQPERALELFRLAARLDLDDVTGTTAGGLHLATMGGVWQALAYGFLGLRPGAAALQVDPCLPAAWRALELRFRFRGRPVGVRAERGRVTVSCTQPLEVRIGAGPARRCDPPAGTFDLPGGAP